MNLQFLNTSKNIPYGQYNLQTSENTPQPIFKFKIRKPVIMFNQSSNIDNIVPIAEEDKKPKMLWGAPIWYLFHTLAEKVKIEAFQSIKNELLNNIYSICINLPCPMCSDHSKEYLNKINFNAIRSKDDLKQMLFDFHNDVNKRKFLKLFTKEELDEKYPTANTINIINNFIYHFKDRNHTPKLIASDLQRSRIVIKLNDWFKNNIQYFD